ncbi:MULTISPECIES: class II aldolase/adducin family protein [unclassified Oscillibacter]|uniref:class II aldolase/adducin family protein n=1 Tax=unclassified Oscillibacter TaxID=2629304 RepID=UPI0025DD1B82|nr:MULTISPECIES: class II aldolase/adducin family protein [unclassified Oscillibacter]
MLMQKERELVTEYGRKLSAAGLCPGTSGNLSIYRPEDGLMTISPSGMDYDQIQPEDVVIADLNGRVTDGGRKPSSEWALHAVFYQHKPKAQAVVHTHSVYCTTFAVLGQSLQAVHYAIGDAGTDEVPCAPYRTFGTPELAQEAIAACGSGNAVLLANHGIVVCGDDLSGAYSLARNLEYVAELQYRALCVGTPNVLTQSQMAQVLERFQSYGQTPGTGGGYLHP